MEMNIDCIRDVLSFIVNTQIIDDNLTIVPVQVKDIYDSEKLKTYSKQEIFYSLTLLKEGEYILCTSSSYSNIVVLFEVIRITYKGHTFYESIREQTVWEKTKSTAKNVGNHTLEFIESIAHDIAVEGVKTILSMNNTQ